MSKKNLKTMNEKELKDYEMDGPKTEEDMINIIRLLVNRSHEYGTCVYAMSIAAEAAFRYMASVLGVTGFQASCADIDFLQRTRKMEHGFAIIDYKNVLYPQFINNPEYFPTPEYLLNKDLEYFQKEAQQLLDESNKEHVAETVWEHWENIVNKKPIKS